MTTRILPKASAVLLGALAWTSASQAQETPRLALVQINQQALFFNQMNEGAQQAAEDAGAELVIFNANNDPAAQNNAIETYVAQGVDGLIVVAIDVNGIMPAVEMAAEAGLPVVAVDAILPEGPQIAQVGVDNADAGRQIGGYFVEYAGENLAGEAQVGIVGALNSFIQNVRQDGFESALEGRESISIVNVVDGRNVQDTALNAAENLITGNPTMNAAYATGEPALLGAIAAVESQGAQDRVKLFGWDLTEQAIRGIEQGFVVAVVQQDPAGMGSAAVEAALAAINGEEVEAQINVPVTIVTRDNVDQFRSMFE